MASIRIGNTEINDSNGLGKAAVDAAAAATANAQSQTSSKSNTKNTVPSSSSAADPTTPLNTYSSEAQTTATQFATNGTSSSLTTVGSALFPMLYLFLIDPSLVSSIQYKVTPADMLLVMNNLKKWSDDVAGHSISTGSGESTNMFSILCDGKNPTNKAKQYIKMFKSASNNNSDYSWMLCNACTNLMAKYKGRIPISGGAYYQNQAKTHTSYYPVLDIGEKDLILKCMLLLLLLLKHDLIDYTFDLGIRPLNIQTGTFYTQEQYSASLMERMRNCGKPIKGQFTINPKQTAPQFYHTFSGVDITAVGAVGNVVTRLEGMTQLSWSVHSGKTTQKPLGKANGGARSTGTRTIAGTMIFTMFDHHPLLDLLPDDLTKYTAKSATSGKQRLYRPRYMPDQIPPFDMTVILMNEYGYSSVVTIYGIQVVDEGTVMSVDNLVSEIVCQYTAVAMDPIIEVQPDENGNIDPYGMISGGWSDLWKQRETVISGVAYTNLEDAYESFYDSNFDTTS